MPIPDYKTPFLDSVVTRYTQGGCFRLARELHFMTGRPIARLDDLHSAIFMDEEEQLILDIEGVWRRAEWLDKWGVFCNAASGGLISITKVEPDWMEPTSEHVKVMTRDVHVIAPMLVAFAAGNQFNLTYPSLGKE